MCHVCRCVYCDGRGHLSSHLLSHPSHNQLYSYKLARIVSGDRESKREKGKLEREERKREKDVGVAKRKGRKGGGGKGE